MSEMALIPTPPDALVGLSTGQNSGGAEADCAVTSDSMIVCWGSPDSGPLPADVAAASNWVALSLGLTHACAINVAGSMTCWGACAAGQCAVPADVTWASVHAAWGSYMTLGISTTGQLYCWGEDAGGICSTADPSITWQPGSVSTGWTYACGLQTSGKLTCWGVDDVACGETCYSWNATVLPIAPGDTFTSVAPAMTGSFTLAIRSDGTMICAGNNVYGQCSIPGGTELVWASASGGERHACGLLLNNTMCVRDVSVCVHALPLGGQAGHQSSESPDCRCLSHARASPSLPPILRPQAVLGHRELWRHLPDICASWRHHRHGLAARQTVIWALLHVRAGGRRADRRKHTVAAPAYFVALA